MYAALNQNNKRILDIGFKTPEDLILDNFGTWLAALIQDPRNATSSTAAQCQLRNVSNTLKDIYTYNINYYASTYWTTFSCNSGSSVAPVSSKILLHLWQSFNSRYLGFSVAPKSET